MKITVIILAGFFVIALGSLALLARNVRNHIEVQYSQAAEEPLVDFAYLFASLIEMDIEEGTVNPSRFRQAFTKTYRKSITARIHTFEKDSIQTHVYITDEKGIVIFDSENGRREGEDYSRYNDVYLCWQGRYGARASRADVGNSRSTVFYIAAPIKDGDRMIGTLTVSRPETAMAPFADQSRDLVVRWSILAAVSTIVLGVVWIYWILHPISDLTRHARAIASGESRAMPITGKAELRALSAALEDMRRELEGKHYVENYVQALTHELKSPLAAIRGAAELIDDSMPQEKRSRFLENILSETARSEDLVRRLVQLASLESQSSLATREPVRLDILVEEAVADARAAIESRNLSIEFDRNGGALEIEGDPLMLQVAIRNLLDNAIDFSPPGGVISIVMTKTPDRTDISFRDQGPGIPQFAVGRAFERFYSLKNRETGRRGSGIGLCLTREAMELHGGDVSLENLPDGGACAVLSFPS